MSTWIGSAELAKLTSTTQRTVNRRAKLENFQSRRRAGRGGGQEYHIASLPPEWRKQIAASRVTEAHRDRDEGLRSAARRQLVVAGVEKRAAMSTAEHGLGKLAQLRGRDRSRAEARLTVLEALDEYTRHSSLSRTAAITAFCAAYNDHQLEIEDDVRGHVPTVHPQSIYRWRRHAKRQGAAALAGHYGNRKGCGLVDSQPELQRFCIAMLTDFPHAGGKHLHRAAVARFGDAGDLNIPGQRALQRWISAFKNENRELMTAIANPDAWKNQHMTAYGDASAAALRLNALWESDATPADIELKDGRHHVMGVIDVYSRRLQLLVTKTSTAQAVATSLRRAIIAWGVPERLKTDNGSDYRSKHVCRVLDHLDVEHIRAAPFSGWEKPHIERVFRTFAHGIVELLPGFIGHNVSERQAIEARQSFADRLLKKNEVVKINMTSSDFQAFCDRWVEDIYHQERHKALGVSPAIKAAGQPARRISDIRALDLLLQDGGVRTVQKKGIRLDGFTYIAPELDCVGQKVHVLLDPDDIGRIHVFRDGEFLCIAEDPQFTGMDRREVAMTARRRQRERVQEQRRELKKAARQEKTRDVAEEILAERARAKDASNVRALPGRAEEYESDHLTAASQAADARERLDRAPEPPPIDEAALARVHQMLREEQREDETAEDRFRRWIRLDQSLEAGETLNDIDRKWKEGYERTSEWKGRHLLYEEFGASAWTG